jgi:hypothetical protein
MSIKAVAPLSPVTNDVALAMVSTPSPMSNYTHFMNPISGPAAVIKLSPEATTMLGK